MYYGLSAGRVQSVTVRIICDREVLIRNFVPEEYWSITAEFRTLDEEKFLAKLTKVARRRSADSR